MLRQPDQQSGLDRSGSQAKMTMARPIDLRRQDSRQADAMALPIP
jgi:hypothetical protein